MLMSFLDEEAPTVDAVARGKVALLAVAVAVGVFAPPD
jgi:hypothetical protein